MSLGWVLFFLALPLLWALADLVLGLALYGIFGVFNGLSRLAGPRSQSWRPQYRLYCGRCGRDLDLGEACRDCWRPVRPAVDDLCDEGTRQRWASVDD